MPRYVPPAGTPIRARDVLRAIRAALTGSTVADRLLALAARLGVRHAWGVSSGRAALFVVLRSLRRLQPERTVVALPAYTCFSVAASIVRSGLTLYPLDMNPDTLDCDPRQFENLPEKTLLCIITSNLFGYVGEITSLQHVAKAKGAFVVDNAAQALGALRDGRYAGTRGDVGIFSLGRGKSLSAIEGGLIVANNEDISHAIELDMEGLRQAELARTSYLLLQLAAYVTLLHPSRYWIPNSLPFLKLGTTEFNPQFAVGALQPIAAHLVALQWDRIREITRTRRSNAARLTEGLHAGHTFYCPQPTPGTEAASVRLPVIAPNESTRALAVARLNHANIGASCFYPSAICDIPGIGPFMATRNHHCRNAEHLSRTLFTLPVHPLVERTDISRMIAVLSSMEEGNVCRTPCREGLSTTEVQSPGLAGSR